jgi:diguanylate cyclase (GGDEF)-like protein/PAS domain S-box-containing protein
MSIKHFIGLRSKMLLAMATGMLLLFALLFFAARVVLLDGYSQLEKEKMLVHVNSAMGMLNEQVEQLSTVTRDYAHWDDAYQFIAKRNTPFIESNLNDTTFGNLKINAIILVDSEGKTIFKKGLNFSTGKPWHLPDSLVRATNKGGKLIDPAKHNASGLLWTSEGICIVSAFDVLDSSLKQPRRGTLIFVRLLDDTLKEKIAKILSTTLSVEGMREDEVSTISPLLAKNKPIVTPLSNNQVAGFALVDGIGNDVKLVLSITSDRKIFKQGKTNLSFLYWSASAIVFLLIAFSLFLDRLVLSRLLRLSSKVKHIGESATMNGRVPTLGGQDEISSLASGINGMLERLDESKHALQFEKDRAQVTLSTLGGIAEAVITSNEAGEIVYMNTAAERLTGASMDEIIGKTLQSFINLMSEDQATAIDIAWLTDSVNHHEAVLLERRDGQTFVIRKSASALYDYNGALFGYVSVLHDITTLRALSDQLSYQAKHDSLTGLVNRYEFDLKVQKAIQDAGAENLDHCLAYIDLDQFKIVNDTCGHIAGDRLLQQLTNLLKSKLRSSDTLARLGGDEFALLLTGCNLENALEIVNNLLNLVRDYRFTYEDKVFKVGASIGLTEITQSNNHTLGELLSVADSACYAAKHEGGNRIHVYRQDDKDMKAHYQQLDWVSRIHLALEKNLFVLYVQEMESLTPNTEQHCELLIRMQDEDGKLYLPGSFLPVAERYRLMPLIDRWVVSEALSTIAKKGTDFTYVCAINLSGQSLSDDEFLEYVINQIKKHHINPNRICFEITETAVITNLDKARQFMHALRGIGCKFSLDDFGSGLSSFAYLKNLEVDFLKIDGMFVKNMANNKIDRAMVESINNVGHVMGIQTIAEFVENDDTIQMLNEIGVNYAQGYGIAMPKLFE